MNSEMPFHEDVEAIGPREALAACGRSQVAIFADCAWRS